MRLFNKKFDDLDFADLQYLRDQKIAESEVLDYKRELPSSKEIAKLVSAFANTYGGFIVVGVEETDGHNTIESFKPLAGDGKDLESKIDSSCYDNITPPIVNLRSRFLEGPDGGRVLLVYVPESDLTPHAVDDNSTVYIKVREQKRGIKKATLERQEWLKNRREKHVKLRESMAVRLKSRYQVIDSDKKTRDPFIEILVLPRFPKSLLVALAKFDQTIYEVVSSCGDGHAFGPWYHKSTHTPDSVLIESKMLDCPCFLEVNTMGGIYIRQMYEPYKQGKGSAEYILPSAVALRFLLALNLLRALLKKLSFNGSIVISSRMTGLKGKRLSDNPSEGTKHYDIAADCNLEDELVSEVTWSRVWDDKAAEGFCHLVLRRLYFAFGASHSVQGKASGAIQSALQSFQITGPNEQVKRP